MNFSQRVSDALSGRPLTSKAVDILQVNMGYGCNAACKHCHIAAGPGRAEMMGWDIVEAVLAVLRGNDIKVLDISGGAPELNPHFRYLVSEAVSTGRNVMVRSNLTVFYEEGMEDLPEFFSDNKVEVVASMPYYLENSVDRIRGEGTFEKSIKSLRRLNELGYGGGGLKLNLVYNPGGAFLPPLQSELEKDYRKELGERFGVVFDNLYTFTNMPLGRFKDFLVRTDSLDKYMEKLEGAFNSETIDGLMCRVMVNVGWDGKLYDCDFNQVLGLHLAEGCPQDIKSFDYEALASRKVTVAEHCYACTAGQGST